MKSHQYQVEIILYSKSTLTKILSWKPRFYKYINRVKPFYHKLIKLKCLIAFILQYKANISIHYFISVTVL